MSLTRNESDVSKERGKKRGQKIGEKKRERERGERGIGREVTTLHSTSFSFHYASIILSIFFIFNPIYSSISISSLHLSSLFSLPFFLFSLFLLSPLSPLPFSFFLPLSPLPKTINTKYDLIKKTSIKDDQILMSFITSLDPLFRHLLRENLRIKPDHSVYKRCSIPYVPSVRRIQPSIAKP